MSEFEAQVGSVLDARLAIAAHRDRMTELRRATLRHGALTVVDLNRCRLALIGIGPGTDDMRLFLGELGAHVTAEELAAVGQDGELQLELVSRHPWGEDRVM
jgi:hypothetical protein